MIEAKKASSSPRWCLEVGNDEQDAKKTVGSGEGEVGRVHTVLQYESADGDDVAEFFEDRGEHERTMTDGIEGDEEESDLPGEA